MSGPTGPGPHVFVDDIDAPVLHASDRHHLERVLRCRRGDPLTVSDGQGRWRSARYGAEVTFVGAVETVPRPEPPVRIALALVKGDRPEWAVQKLTELGADDIVLFSAHRSVVRWDATRATRQLTRLRRVARSAAEQSRRCWLPIVDVLADLGALAEAHGGSERLVRAQRGGTPPVLDGRTVVIGPEGGWSDEERALVPRTVGLGSSVLRSETAAVAATALLAGARSGITVSAAPSDRIDT